MQWNHILDKQPESGSVIIQIEKPFKLYDNDFKYHYTMGMRQYEMNSSWKDYMQWCENNNCYPNFWWVYAKDFPFPNQPDRLSPETQKCEAIVETHAISMRGSRNDYPLR